jgi:hypothetical protein
VLDLVHLCLSPVLGPHLHQHGQRIIVTALRDQPARRFRHLQHSEEEHHGGDRTDSQHDAPHTGQVAPDGEDDRVDDEGEHLADHDGELVAPAQRAASLGGRELGQIDRHGHRGAPDGEPEDEPCRQHDGQVRSEHGTGCADEEDYGEDRQRLLAAHAVVHPTAGQGTDGGADQQDAGDQALGDGREPEVLLHGLQGAVDHSGVVAEQQSAERGDDGDEVESSLMGTRPQGRQCDAAHRAPV